MAKNSYIIELNQVSKRYGSNSSEYLALKDFDLNVKQGEFIMIMGPSGCGKTTLLNLIGLLDKPTSGEYLLNSVNTSKLSASKKAKLRSREIGFIFQNFNLINNLPVLENVGLPLLYSGFSKLRREKMAEDVLDNFHLKERQYYKPYQLSGGQQQRVAIARSLVANPSLILADEPTGNLDSRSSHIVMEELRNLHSAGNTIIMVTHNPSLLGYATRVINMLDGEIDTDIKTVEDKDLPVNPDEPKKVLVRLKPVEKSKKPKKVAKAKVKSKKSPKKTKSKKGDKK
jgi:putative ABC transport system ATP-binding protein